MRLPRFAIPPLRDWALLGRPVGEWLYLAAMSANAVNQLRNVVPQGSLPAAARAVVAGQFLIGATSLGVVVATILGWRAGLRLLWLFALAVCATVAIASRSMSGAPFTDAVLAVLGALGISSAVVWYGRRRLHAAITHRLWPALLRDHAAAADAFVADVTALSPAQWQVRPEPEAWSPAEITDHLARTYSQYAGEARGKNALRIRLPWPQRWLARAFVKPRLLNGAPFPKAKAPRALRPGTVLATPADGVALFRATGSACLRDLGLLAERRPYRQLVHPYLGALPLYDMVRFATQHVRHHHRQLLAVAAMHPPMERPDVNAS
jgi:hypothetical protein